jgi:histidine ammonia-lyase
LPCQGGRRETAKSVAERRCWPDDPVTGEIVVVSEHERRAVTLPSETAAMQEDHISLGTSSALRLLTIIDNVGTVLAIELLVASQALDFRLPARLGAGTAVAHACLRAVSPRFVEDRVVAPEIARRRRPLRR